jgi:hypothetical protein
MALSRCAKPFGLLLALSVVFDLAGEVQAVPTVWSGPTVTFTKTGADTADTTDPLNQDRLTSNVWLTRASSQGMFNIAPGKESFFTSASPADTLWATSVMPTNVGKTIAASNWPQLSFTTWAPAYGGPGSALGSNTTTHNAVVHLITEDIYLDLTFSLYTSGGNFIYQRSTAVPEPSTAVGALVASGLFCWARRGKTSALFDPGRHCFPGFQSTPME